MRASTGDRGQAAVLVLMVATVLFVGLSSAVVAVGGRMVDRTRAQTAADAAALAGSVGGRDAADMMARRHGASVVSFSRGPSGADVTVVVRRGAATAKAAAAAGGP